MFVPLLIGAKGKCYRAYRRMERKNTSRRWMLLAGAVNEGSSYWAGGMAQCRSAPSMSFLMKLRAPYPNIQKSPNAKSLLDDAVMAFAGLSRISY